jgi:NAD(P)-dependent dehydrogenase (short-subunit alcohol dehydrogenase family)
MGWSVYGASRSAPPPSALFTFTTVDVRDDRSVHDCVAKIEAETGRIDVLVNCAGIAVGGSAEEMLGEEVMDQVQTNLLGTMRTCQAVLPGMRSRRSGLIINVGSLAGLMGVPFQSAYSATKYGVEGYSESLQIEVRSFGVRVVMVDPGDVATEISVHRVISRGTAAASPYRDNLERAMRSQQAAERAGWRVDRLAGTIARIAGSRSPRFRYTPGPFVERLSPVARRFLPNRLFLKILGVFYGLKRSG